jgi:hypothetical protein
MQCREYAEGRRLWVEWGATNATECLDVPAGSTAQVWVAEASTIEDVAAVRAAIKQSAARELVSSGTVTVVLGDLPVAWSDPVSPPGLSPLSRLHSHVSLLCSPTPDFRPEHAISLPPHCHRVFRGALLPGR